MAKTKVTDIKCLLQKSLGYDFEIIDERITALTGPGEHYGSVMLALDLKIRCKTENNEEKALHLAAKRLPVNEMLRVAFDVEVTFRKEVLAYTKAVPVMVDFQKEFQVSEERSFSELFPKCFGARVSLDENSNKVDEGAILLFENLKVQGFYTEDRLVGFDFDAAKMILEDLAFFHATPLALKLVRPQVFNEKVMPCLVKNRGLERLSEEVKTAFHDSILDGARDVPVLEPYLEKLQKICDFALEHPITDRHPPNEPWGTMCHLDFWTSNTMLRRDEKGTPIKNVIVDLQLIEYSSGLRDLVFFLFTSVINEVLEKHFDQFLRIYHKKFLEILRGFGIDLGPFSWENYRKELDAVVKDEIYHVLVMLKPICTEKGKVLHSAEEFQDSDWSRKDLLGPNHRRKLRDTVLAIAKQGWL